MNHVSPPVLETLEPRVLFSATWLYGVDSGSSDGSSNLFRIDEATGDLVDVGEIGYRIRDIAFTPDGNLWGVTDNRLININRDFAFGRDVGPIAFEAEDDGNNNGGGGGTNDNEKLPPLNALASDAAGRLFATTVEGQLIRFEPRLFQPFPPRPINAAAQGLYGRDFLSSGDIAFDHDGTLFATGNRENRTSYLLEVNPRTGYSYPRGNPLGGRAAEGLAVGPDQKLYAIVRGNQSNPVLLDVNRASGVGTPIAVIDNADGMVGLAAAPVGKSPIAFLMDQALLASKQTFAQLYNVGVKYAAFISTTLSNGAGADIYIDLADYYASLANTDLSPEGDGDWITVWINKHHPDTGSAMPFSLGAVPLRFQGAATDPTGQFQFGRLSRDYPFRRDPLVEATTVRIENDTRDRPAFDGAGKAIHGSATHTTGPADPSLHLVRFEIRRQTLDAMMTEAAAQLDNQFEVTPAAAAAALARTFLTEAGDSVTLNYARFAPWQIRTFTPTDLGVSSGPGRNNAFHLGSFRAAGQQKYAVGWVGLGTRSNYFSFSLTGSNLVDISIPRLDGNVSLFLEDRAGHVLAVSANPGTQTEKINTVLAAGTYYVRVQSANPYDAGFSLRVATVPGELQWANALLASQQRTPTATFAAADDTATDDLDLDLLGGKALVDL